MSSAIYQEWGFLLTALWLGAGITFCYDCLLILRRVTPHGTVLLSTEDLLFWLFVSIRIFYLLYDKNDGAFRWFAILGAALGMVVYKKTLSPLFVKYGSRLLGRVLGIFSRIAVFFFRPVRRAAHTAGSLAGRKAVQGGRRLCQIGRFYKKRLTVKGKMVRMELCKHYGCFGKAGGDGKKKDRF